MTHINLLPLEQRRPQVPYGRVSLFFVGLCLVAMGCIYGVEAFAIWSLEKDLLSIQSQYEELLPVKQDMEQAGDKQKQIDGKMVLVNELAKTRTTPYQILPQIAALLSDSIWLDETKVNKDDGRFITLLGGTGDYTELAAFISRLEKEPVVSSVALKSTEGDMKTGILKFTLDLKLKENQ